MRQGCRLCGKTIQVSKSLGVCRVCLRERPDEAVPVALEGHEYLRRLFGLPPDLPRHRAESHAVSAPPSV